MGPARLGSVDAGAKTVAPAKHGPFIDSAPRTTDISLGDSVASSRKIDRSFVLANPQMSLAFFGYWSGTMGSGSHNSTAVAVRIGPPSTPNLFCDHDCSAS